MNIKRLIIYFALATLTVVGAVADSGAYKLENAFVNIKVSKDNVWDVTEVLDVNFEESRHGIYRYIPSKFFYSFPDASGKMVPREYTNYIYDCQVYHHEYSVENDNTGERNVIIKIGSAKERVTGRHNYVIKYKIRYFDDQNNGEDFLCHTMWGNGWNTKVDTLMFQVAFEKPLPADIEQSLNTYSGKLGSTANADSVYVHFCPEENAIKGVVYNLPAGHAVTVSSQLPQGFWEIQPKDLTLFYTFAGLACVCGLVVIVLLIFTPRHKSVRTLSFYPPEGMSSAEVGTVVDCVTGYNDLASLIPWLAHRGYIKIVENTGKGGMKVKDDLTLVKLQDMPDDAPEYQRSFMKALFWEEDSVRLKSLTFTTNTIQDIVKQVGRIFTGERALCIKNSRAVCAWMLMLMCMLGAAATCSLVEVFSFSNLALELLSVVGVLFWMGRNRMNNAFEYQSNGMIGNIVSVIKWSLVMFFAVYVNIVWLDDGFLAVPTGYFIVGSILFSIVTHFLHYALSNTMYRAKVLGEIEGLREFINTAEVPRLKMLVDENPQYFYDVLPYAMALGLTNKWVSLFETIKIEHPEWYAASASAGISALPGVMDKISTGVTDSIKASIASSGSGHSHSLSGGGSSGGGRSFSGGGGGGGGGGSW